jgi:tRNA pseudouridine32 synthase/23S rRNA pseudouridine746 synthase
MGQTQWSFIHNVPLKGKTRAVAFAALLVLYGNLISLGPLDPHEELDWAYTLGNLLLTAVILLWAIKVERLSLAEIGFTKANAFKSAAIGGAIAVLVSLPVIAYFAFPVVVDEPIDYDPVKDWSLASFLIYALVKQPLGTALFEETAFRGVLQAKMIGAFPLRQALMATALTFALWHIVINYRTVQETNVGDSPALAILAQAGSLVGLFIGGLFMSLLRHYTRNLTAPIVFHWLVVVLMTGALIVLND